MSEETYETRLGRLMAHGDTETSDYYPDDGRDPYRRSVLEQKCSYDAAPMLAFEIAKLAVDVAGHLTMYVHPSYDGAEPFCEFVIAIHRPLTESEISEHQAAVAGGWVRE